MKIDKRNWKTYRFDEFAENISQRVEPQNTDLTIYVGLEHLDPDSLHIKRHGSPSDVKGTKLKLYKGDVIFGKRRAYQRKAALAEYDGICSAHAMVLRAKTDIIDERLFPFFFHSTVFQTRAIDISVGGLSPTINWKDLAKQEFLLPPKEEQTRLAELLWAADEVMEKERILEKQLATWKNVRMNVLLNGVDVDIERWEQKKISEIGLVSTSGVDKKSRKNEKEVNLINYMDVYSSFTKKITNDISFMKVTAKPIQLEKNQVYKGDILFTPSSETKDDIGHSAVVYEELEGTLYSYHLVRLHFFENINIDIDYKRYMFNNPQILNYFSKKAQGITRMTLGLDDFNNTKILIPPMEIQKAISTELSNIDTAIVKLQIQIQKSQQLKSSLINQIF